ncbi:hypothetical protein [Flammeovirga sp. SubArs3]|uniref:hypothetical protein n=1 Tax=Flammeovirga sp. SubArs3 TaxID=2995316 RepID=UPI00248BE43C|nr:hypothetical protein [Flammeovirga sp. SubArs3]
MKHLFSILALLFVWCTALGQDNDQNANLSESLSTFRVKTAVILEDAFKTNATEQSYKMMNQLQFDEGVLFSNISRANFKDIVSDIQDLFENRQGVNFKNLQINSIQTNSDGSTITTETIKEKVFLLDNIIDIYINKFHK